MRFVLIIILSLFFISVDAQIDSLGYHVMMDSFNGVWGLKLASTLKDISSKYDLKFKEEYNDFKVYTISNIKDISPCDGCYPIPTELYFYNDSLTKITLEKNNSEKYLLQLIESKFGDGTYVSGPHLSTDINFSWSGRKSYAHYKRVLDNQYHFFIESFFIVDRVLYLEYQKEQEQYIPKSKF